MLVSRYLVRPKLLSGAQSGTCYQVLSERKAVKWVSGQPPFEWSTPLCKLRVTIWNLTGESLVSALLVGVIYTTNINMKRLVFRPFP